MNITKQKIINNIIEKIENIPNLTWNKMWRTEPPRNLEGRKYNGINIINLNLSSIGKEYKSNIWGTFLQIKNSGGKILKGEKSSIVTFYKFIDKIDREKGEKTGEKIPYLKEYRVFNLEQTTLKEKDLNLEPVIKENPEELLKSYLKEEKIDLNHSFQGKACYRTMTDDIILPPKKHFINIDEYYSTAFHESVHSTGHEKRMNRDLTGLMGNEKYAKEELIAEIGSAFLLNSCGIENADVEKNNAAYLKGWLEKIKSNNNKELLFIAANQSNKAFSFINEKSNLYLNKIRILNELENIIPKAKVVILENTENKKKYIEERYTHGEKEILVADRENPFDLKAFEILKYSSIKEAVLYYSAKEYQILEEITTYKINKDYPQDFQLENKKIEVDNKNQLAKITKTFDKEFNKQLRESIIEKQLDLNQKKENSLER